MMSDLPVRIDAVKDDTESIQVVLEILSEVSKLWKSSQSEDISPGAVGEPVWGWVGQVLGFGGTSGKQVAPLILRKDK